MTDDEVKQWLSEDEREAFDAVMPTRPALRSLAETRKALAAMLDASEEAQGFSGSCPLCKHQHARHSMTARYAHAHDCIFATMPRPK